MTDIRITMPIVRGKEELLVNDIYGALPGKSVIAMVERAVAKW